MYRIYFKLLTKQKLVPNKFEFSNTDSKVSNMVKIMHVLFIWVLYRRVIYRRRLTKNMVTLFVLSLSKELLLLLIFYKQTIEPEKPHSNFFFFTWVSPISKNKCGNCPPWDRKGWEVTCSGIFHEYIFSLTFTFEVNLVSFFSYFVI